MCFFLETLFRKIMCFFGKHYSGKSCVFLGRTQILVGIADKSCKAWDKTQERMSSVIRGGLGWLKRDGWRLFSNETASVPPGDKTAVLKNFKEHFITEMGWKKNGERKLEKKLRKTDFVHATRVGQCPLEVREFLLGPLSDAVRAEVVLDFDRFVDLLLSHPTRVEESVFATTATFVFFFHGFFCFFCFSMFFFCCFFAQFVGAFGGRKNCGR